ncbi:MAG TPA: iron-sulfur cluster assembly scaffold protein [Candidatus Aenigmarchaeota archaeon]|nr:iron-sulfur cluster assembly scaffold protein [Candidatus Aenigmarchaeota archaeon]
MYSEKVLDHFKHPRNQGRIENPDGVGKVGNPVCGDMLWFYIKVENNVIVDLKWETYGCAAAIAVSSMVSEMVKGKTIEEALKLTNKDVLKELGNLPPVKIHCSLLGVEALQEAIYDYMKKRRLKIPKELEEAHKRNVKTLNVLEERE